MLGASVVVSAAVLAAWLPAGDLLMQRHQQAAEAAQLHKLSAEDRRLAREEHRLTTPSSLSAIAQQQYGLVPAGEQEYEVQPPSNATSSGLGTAATSASTTPASTSPSTSTTTSPSTSTPSSSSSSAKGVAKTAPTTAGATSRTAAGPSASSGSPSFFGRVLDTLEFWR